MRELAKKYNGTRSVNRIKKEAERKVIGDEECLIFFMIDNDILSDNGVQESYKTHGNYFVSLKNAEKYADDYVEKFKNDKRHFNPAKLEDDEWFEVTIRRCYVPVKEMDEFTSFDELQEWDDWASVEVKF